jgi:histidine ammonia-lyase
MGSSAPFHPDIHTLRGHRGQIDTAAALRACSRARSSAKAISKATNACRTPTASAASRRSMALASISCAGGPHAGDRSQCCYRQSAGAVDDSVVSGGNFHAEPVAFAADQIALAICEIGAIAQRRIALLVDPALSYGLPAFLAASRA